MNFLIAAFFLVLLLGLLHRLWRDFLAPVRETRCRLVEKYRQESPFFSKYSTARGQGHYLRFEVDGRSRVFQVSPWLYGSLEAGRTYTVRYRGGRVLEIR